MEQKTSKNSFYFIDCTRFLFPVLGNWFIDCTRFLLLYSALADLFVDHALGRNDKSVLGW